MYEKYQKDLRLSHASSSFAYESVERNIHFNKIDLQSGATYIESPKWWLKNKKATINRTNTNDVCRFMHSIIIALFYDKLGTNPERITKKLATYAQAFNWQDIDFPAGHKD